MAKALKELATKLAPKFRRPRQMELEDYLAKLLDKGLNPDGTPMLDPTPMAPPIGYKKHPSMVEIVRDMVRSERLAQAAAESGHETFEESEDFDVGDDPELLRSQWENEFDPPLSELVRAGEEAIRAREAASRSPSESPPTPPAPRAEPAPPSDGQ